MAYGPEGVALSEFHSAYTGAPAWEIGRPQPVFVRLADAGEIRGSILDVGCGTGEHVIYFARRGHEVWGIDAVPAAIERARSKAAEAGVNVTLIEGDALHLERLGRTFDTVIDSGLFHVFSNADRLKFVASLHNVLPPGGRYFMEAFSDRETRKEGPRRLSEGEIHDAFRDGWVVESIEPVLFDSLKHPGGAAAWLSRIRRT